MSAELENLINLGAAIDAGAEQEHNEAMGIPEPVQPDPDAQAMEWLIVPQMLSWAIKTIFPEVAQHYTPENEMNLARAIVPVADKYGWSGFGGSPELMLGVAAVGFAMPAVLAYRERKEQKRERVEVRQDGAVDGSH